MNAKWKRREDRALPQQFNYLASVDSGATDNNIAINDIGHERRQ